MAQYSAPSIAALNERLSALQGQWKPDETRVFIADVIGYRSEALRVATAPITSLTAQYKGEDINKAIQDAQQAVMFSRQYAVQATKLIIRAMGELRHYWQYYFPASVWYAGKEKRLQAVYNDTAYYVAAENHRPDLFVSEALGNLERIQREISTEARVRLELQQLQAAETEAIPL